MNKCPNCLDCGVQRAIRPGEQNTVCSCVTRIHDEVILPPRANAAEVLALMGLPKDFATRVAEDLSKVDLADTVRAVTEPSKGCAMLHRDRQPLVAGLSKVLPDPGRGPAGRFRAEVFPNSPAGPDSSRHPATYTVEMRWGEGLNEQVRQFSGLVQGDIDTLVKLREIGWNTEQIVNHLDEVQTAHRVRLAQSRRDSNPEVLALGFSLDEIETAAVEIRKDIENALSRKDMMEAISRGIIRLMIRRTINGMVRASGGNTQYLAQMAKNNMLSVSEAFQASAGRDVDYSQIEARLMAHFADKQPLPIPKAGFATGGRVCGKAAFLKQMYGGSVTGRMQGDEQEMLIPRCIPSDRKPAKTITVQVWDESHTLRVDAPESMRVDGVLLDGKAVLAVALNVAEGWVEVYAEENGRRSDRIERKHGKVEVRWKK